MKHGGEPSEAERLEARRKRRAELDDIRAVLAQPHGYRFVTRLLAYCKTFESPWSPGAEIHKNVGKQEVGHMLFGEVVQADPDTLMKIALEIKRQQQDDENKEAENNG